MTERRDPAAEAANVRVTEINIVPIRPRNGLVAFASFVLNGWLYVGSVGIYTSLNAPGGFRLAYPTIRLKNGREIECACPLKKEYGEAIRRAVEAEYYRIIGTLTERRPERDSRMGVQDADEDYRNREGTPRGAR